MQTLSITSLRRKLVLVIMLTVGMALLLAMGAYLAIEVQGFRRAARVELVTLAEVMGEGCAAAIEFDNAKEATQLLANLRVQKRIFEAALLDGKGKLFAVYQRESGKPFLLPEHLPLDGSVFRDGHLWLSRPVMHAGERVGTIFLRADLVELKARLRWVVGGGILLTLLIGSAATLLAIRMGHIVAEPILHLTEAARRIANHQDLGERVLRESQDEVGILVDAFNDMLDQIGERQAGLEEAQQLAHLGNWSFDPETLDFQGSEETFRITGLPSCSGRVDMEQVKNLVHPEDLPEVGKRLSQAWHDRAVFQMDHRIFRPDGELRWVHLRGAFFGEWIEGKRLVRGTLMDITERKQSEAALMQGQKLESLGVLAGGIAHDFNNLLTALQGYLDLAQEELEAGSSVKSHLDKADKVVQKAANLSHQMLAYSGRGQFQRKQINLGQLVKEMGHLLSVSISKKAQLRYEMGAGIPVMVGDPAQVQQVIMNLVINASDALKDNEGYILIHTGSQYLEESDLHSVFAGQALEPGLYVTLEVQDNGHGMDAQTLSRIFDPFFTTKFHGRGLGLAAMLGILKGHQGAIKVYSEVGKGTTFRLLFPASSGGSDQLGATMAGGEYRGTGSVLVVDDEPDIRDAVSMTLQHMGFEVLQAVDGQEGLERFLEHHHELRLVLLDLTMPRMDGAECLKAMRMVNTTVPVLLSSGFSEHECKEDLAAMGLAGFLQKPYTAAALSVKLREILERNEGP